jgi:1-acyl-sn-glycerol-3-phosphate acyltransferase
MKNLIKGIFEITVIVVLLSVFDSKINQNNIYIFLKKIIFDISILK